MKYFFLWLVFLFCFNANAIDRFCNGAPTTIQANGGGHVALTAIVESTVFVGPEAAVCEYAMVFGTAQISDNSRVYGKAQVGDGSLVSGNAEVYGNAQLTSNFPTSVSKVIENAKIYGNASVLDGAVAKGNSRVFENARVSLAAVIDESARAYGNATITDTALVKGASRIYGNAFIGLNTIVNGESDLCSFKKYPADTVLSNVTYCLIAPKPIPAVTSVIPNNGPVSGGSIVTIVGTNFVSGDSVFIGAASCAPVIVINSTTISCTTSAHIAGNANVVVTNVDSKSGTLLNGYTYNEGPSIASISPNGGVLAGGTPVVITGNNFVSGVIVNLGGSVCNVVSVNTTTINCTTTSHAAGVVAVNVANPDGQMKNLSKAYTYRGAPNVVNVYPKISPLAGGLIVTISGNNFIAGAVVEIDGILCSNINVLSSTKITCIPESHSAGIVNVRVTNSDTQTGVLVGGYIYQGPPTIASVSQNAGSLAGGNIITINGTNFFSGVIVKIGNGVCLSPVVLNSSTIQCKAPARTAGTVNVVVTNVDNQFATLLNGYTYQLSPSVYSISPTSGFSAGGTDITITGSNFLAGATVDLGGVACNNVAIVSLTKITCKTPAHSVGYVRVSVTNTDTQKGGLENGFYYHTPPVPTVSNVSPSGGPLAGGLTVTIKGSNFISGASIDIGGVSCSSVIFIDSSTMTCVTGAHASGAVNVIVTNPDTQTGALNNGFTYRAIPVVASVSPSSGSQYGGQLITITGNNFATGMSVKLGEAICGGVSFVNTTTITCTTSSHGIGSVSVDVTDKDSQTGTLANGYAYQVAPRIVSSYPASGALAGGTLLTITGENFLSGASVYVGGVACSVTSINSSTIKCMTGAHAAGYVDLAVTNPDGMMFVVSNRYAYRVAPTIASISPSNGSINGGTFVTISGTGFYYGINAKIGNLNCYDIVVRSSTEFTCKTNPGTSGIVDVKVDSDGQSAILPSSFVYRAPIALTSVAKVGAGPGHVCARLNNGDIRCWGNGVDGQLGDGNGATLHSPGPILNLGAPATHIALSNSLYAISSTCAILNTGALKCWGANEQGQLGYGDDLQRLSPGGNIALGGSVIQVAMGTRHTCALLSTGTVRCWGANYYGQLGYGDYLTIFSPGATLSFGEAVTQITAGGYHSCVLLASGSVRCWGLNNVGQLGYGDTENRPSPGGNVAIGGVATQIVASDSHTCALLNTGAVRCWGNNGAGELGYGDTVIRLSPGANINLGGIATQISIAINNSCALLNTGAIRCWGSNNRGQLGYGDTVDRNSPGGDIPLNSPATQIAVGTGFACATTNTGTVRCWGSNSYGQLGLGNSPDQHFPWGDVNSFSGNSSKIKSRKNYVEVFQNNKEKYWSDNE
ncbi:hypothetical protein DOM21_08900 [Bacteriovorax stolpii]|uniref:IPT/TIG domain-containing protein n=1 Tax=Bacteriovorax stolpii TaxID=960 RepID=UPI0011573BD4|nr:IPT/TIG domain-containing protein [Bacteriovorax stolpii]QDK41568.1 hypothetical protein DOM21_08900 [Bacteriovorax stolpii]